MASIYQRFLAALIISFRMGGWFLFLCGGLSVFTLFKIAEGTGWFEPVQLLNSNGLQSFILLCSVAAAVKLYEITARTALHRATMHILHSESTDRDLIRSRVEFFKIVVWYKENLAELARGHVYYKNNFGQGGGIPMAQDDPRRFGCGCHSEFDCSKNDGCPIAEDGKARPRLLSVGEYAETRQSLIHFLNYQEYISIGILSGAYQEQTLYDASRTAYVEAFISAAPYIQAARSAQGAANKKLYVKFEEVARRWADPKTDEEQQIDAGLGV